jgi:2-methylcitrate dehydratase
VTLHEVRVVPSRVPLPREAQLAWKIAAVASDAVAGARVLDDADVVAMVGDRLIDNAAVALAAIDREPVANARSMALAHPRAGGATLYGLPATTTVGAEWAAWANATAVRELDFHDTFLAADYAHPGDSIAPVLAVAQQLGRTGADLVRGIAVAYEVHVALVKGICLHAHKKDHMAHLAPASAAGIGALLGLPTEVVYQAVQQAVHTSFSTRQSRKGEISSWKAYVPGYSGLLAVLAVDRAMRGERSPSPIYEGEDSVIAWMLGGRTPSTTCPCPTPASRPGRSSRPTRRSTPPSTRRRR